MRKKKTYINKIFFSLLLSTLCLATPSYLWCQITQCNDGIDNDGDGLIDWQFDLGCYGCEDVDEGGKPSGSLDNSWTVFEPSPDTKIIYVSSSEGDDSWSGLAPEWNGTDGPKKTILAGKLLLREGYPDWLLLKRGNTWVGERLGTFRQPYGPGEDIWELSGRSEEEKMVIATYGNSLERAHIDTKSGSLAIINSRNKPVEHVAFIGLHSYSTSDTLSTTPGIAISGWNGGQIYDLLFEDVFIDGGSHGAQKHEEAGVKNIILRRCIITDSWNVRGHSGGMFTTGVDGLTFEECIFDHGGWHPDSNLRFISKPSTKNVADWKTIYDGQFTIQCTKGGGSKGDSGNIVATYDVSGVDFSSASSMDDVAEILNSSINSAVGSNDINVKWFEDDVYTEQYAFRFYITKPRNETNLTYMSFLVGYQGLEPGTEIADMILKEAFNPKEYEILGGTPRASMFNRNLYIGSGAGTPGNNFLIGNIISRSASEGIQLRPGGVMEDNLLLNNPAVASVGTILSESEGDYAHYSTIKNNVALGSGRIDSDNRGWGMVVNPNLQEGAVFENNILAHKPEGFGDAFAFAIFKERKQNLMGKNINFRNNVVYNWPGTSLQIGSLVDGPEYFGNSYDNITVANNIFNPGGENAGDDVLVEFTYYNGALGGNVYFDPEKISFSSNKYYSGFMDRGKVKPFWPDHDPLCRTFEEWVETTGETDAEFVQVDFADPSRNIETYNRDILERTADFEDFITEAKKQSKYNWRPEYTAHAVNEYIREGFGIDSPILYGDVSGNKVITSYDAALIAQYLVDPIEHPLDADQLIRADVSGNGTVSSLDAALIAQYVVGIITQFPVEEGGE